MSKIITHLKIVYWRWLAWWCDHRPVRCAECGRWMQDRRARRERSTTGRVVVFCKACWVRHFRPFSGLDKRR